MIVRTEGLRVTDEIQAACREEKRQQLTEWETYSLLRQWEIPVAQSMLAADPDEAGAAAAVITGPLAVKVVSPDIAHKTEVGAVRLGLTGAAEVADGARAVLEAARHKAPQARIHGVLVQQMAPRGVELIAGCTRDRSFGPVIMAGVGGIFTEVLKDVAFRLAPARPDEVLEMLRDLKGFPLLVGVRGGPPVDLVGLTRCLVNLGDLLAAWPVLQEIELNPLVAWEGGVLAVDGLARIAV